MSLLVKRPGILSTGQDLGRTGSRALGINVNGAMDRNAVRLINTLLGNDEGEAVIEMHFPAAELVFESDCSFALGGADLGARLNDEDISLWTTISGRKGDTLSFVEKRIGSRCYLSVAGGFDIEPWLGSKSTNLVANIGGFEGRCLRTGDRVPFNAPQTRSPRKLGPTMTSRYSRFPTVRFVASGEFDSLTAISERDLLSEAFTITNDSNRMGFRLSGKPLFLLDQREMISSGVAFGTIQLLPSGQLIVLMADHQTSGGYPRLGNVISADLPLLGQLGPSDGVGFHLISIDEAERLASQFEKDLCTLRLGVALW